MTATSDIIKEAMTSSTGLVTNFHRNFTVINDAEALKLSLEKEACGQVRGYEVVNHLPFDPNDHDVQQYSWEG